MRVKSLVSDVGRRRMRVLGCALALTVGVSAPAAGQEASQGARPGPDDVTDRADARTVRFDGLQVAIDPATGRIRQPTREEARAMAGWLRGMMRRSALGLRPQIAPSGAVTVDLEGRFLTLAVATRDEGGRVQLECLETADEVATRLDLPAPVAPRTPARSAEPGGTR